MVNNAERPAWLQHIEHRLIPKRRRLFTVTRTYPVVCIAKRQHHVSRFRRRDPQVIGEIERRHRDIAINIRRLTHLYQKRAEIPALVTKRRISAVLCRIQSAIFF